MVTSLQFGGDSLVDLDLPSGSLVGSNTLPHVQPIEDTVAAVCAALEEPIEFPAVRSMVLPDDHVAIALEPNLACASELLSGTISSLMSAGVPPELIQVVRAPDDRGLSDGRLFARVDSAVASRIEVLRHDPNDREHLRFLGASRGGQAFYVNRTLCDAAVVIPIGSYHADAGRLGVHHSWFPVFADVETQERFHKSMSSISNKKREKRKAECQEAAWMLGVQLVAHVIPAGDNGALHVLAGSPDAVWAKGNELAETAWHMKVSRRASLVIAAIGGGPEQQTWENVVQSIDTSLKAVEVDGAIAVCSHLKSKPGPALRRLAGAEDFECAERAIHRKPTADTSTASRLNHALQRARVYLLSELDEGVVEDLGIAYVSNSSEISKLSTQHDSCLVVQNAQYVSISLDLKGDT